MLGTQNEWQAKTIVVWNNAGIFLLFIIILFFLLTMYRWLGGTFIIQRGYRALTENHVIPAQFGNIVWCTWCDLRDSVKFALLWRDCRIPHSVYTTIYTICTSKKYSLSRAYGCCWSITYRCSTVVIIFICGILKWQNRETELSKVLS